MYVYIYIYIHTYRPDPAAPGRVRHGQPAQGEPGAVLIDYYYYELLSILMYTISYRDY